MKGLRILDHNLLRFYSQDRKPKIAIVGNAGVTEEDEEHISNADIVVRFNNYGTRANISHTKDKLKCDVLFSTFDLHSQGSKPKDVVIAIPFPFKAKEIDCKPALWYPRSRLWTVNSYENLKLCEELGLESEGYKHPLPSVGLTALYHMRNWNAEFYITGYKWYFSDETNLFQNHHLSNKKYPKIWNHFYPLEVEWILNNLKGKNNIKFSQDCNRILNIAWQQLYVDGIDVI